MYARFRKALMKLLCYCSEMLWECYWTLESFYFLFWNFLTALKMFRGKTRRAKEVSNSPSFLLHLQKKGAKKRSPKSMYARFRSALMWLGYYCVERLWERYWSAESFFNLNYTDIFLRALKRFRRKARWAEWLAKMLFEERSDEFIFATQRAVVFAVTFSQPWIFFCFFSLFQDKEKKGNDWFYRKVFPSFLLFLQKKGAKKRRPKSMYGRFRKPWCGFCATVVKGNRNATELWNLFIFFCGIS